MKTEFYQVKRRFTQELHLREFPCNDNWQDPLADQMIRRFLLRAGWLRSTPEVIELVHDYMFDFIETMAKKIADASGNRYEMRLDDVLRAARSFGYVIYGYDDTCELQGYDDVHIAVSKNGKAKYHVTEMIEYPFMWTNPTETRENQDLAPGTRYTKTNFVENYLIYCQENDSGNESDQESTTSEWLFSQSDTDDSESESESEYDEQSDAEEETKIPVRSHTQLTNGDDQAQTTGRNVLLESLQEAQELIDKHLLDKNQQNASAHDDAEEMFGQGYHSDFEVTKEPPCMTDWSKRATEEEALWRQEAPDHFVMDEHVAVKHLEKEEQEWEDGMAYIMPRHHFRLLATMHDNRLPVYSAALSAFHNVVEHAVMRSLVSGPLRVKLMTTELQNVAVAVEESCHPNEHKVNHVDAMQQEREQEIASKSQQLARQLEEECTKTKEKDRVIRLLAEANNQLTSTLTTQEKTMQRQIKQLEKQLQQYQAAQEAPTEAITPAKSKRTPSKRTPATKRKASEMPAISPAPKRLIQAIDKAPLAKTKGNRLSTITRSRSTKA